jgi:hypothetical protein
MSVCETWPIRWPSPVNVETTRVSNGNCGHLGIPKRPNYYAASESVKGWTACDAHRGSLERHGLRASACSVIVKMKAPGPLANSSEPHI